MDKFGDALQAVITLAPYVIIGALGPMLILHGGGLDDKTHEILANIVSGMIGAATSGGAHAMVKALTGPKSQ